MAPAILSILFFLPLMFRTLFSLLLAAIVVAEAAAQTTPTNTTAATSSTTTVIKKNAPAKPRPVRTTTRKKSTKRVGNPKTSTKRTITVLPAPPENRPFRKDIGPNGNGSVGSTANADGKGQGVYAAPGQPVNVQSTKVEGYDGPAPKPAKSENTLTPSSSTPK
jgi:hypothetical protein